MSLGILTTFWNQNVVYCMYNAMYIQYTLHHTFEDNIVKHFVKGRLVSDFLGLSWSGLKNLAELLIIAFCCCF
jgi:hypothetical protein